VSSPAGGKGLNVARVAQCLGGKVCCLGFLGDFTGGFIEKEIEVEGLINHFTPIQGTTRICMNFRDKSRVAIEILEGGAEITPEEIKLLLIVWRKVFPKTIMGFVLPVVTPAFFQWYRGGVFLKNRRNYDNDANM
jgi:fructose-1-phosphate kinase PfkB-like protein